MTEGYSISKDKLIVRIALAGIGERQIELFLGPCARTGRPERPSDLLIGDEPFLPVLDMEGDLTFIHITNVLFMTVPLETEQSGDELSAEDLAAALTSHMRVRVTMEDGSRLEGTVYYLLPIGKQRLQDFLNTNDPFISLHKGENVILINKTRIVCVTAIEEIR